MSDTKEETQAKLDDAQEDLEKNIAELKQVLEDKLETPKQVVEAVEKPIAFVREHAVLIGMGVVFALGLLVGRITSK
ncbi:MAG TPA: hypothetical protein VFQ65_00025 [Kofleriaceae bacterium]|nr:hypothetical protein [Kofleriaceae bacterium]